MVRQAFDKQETLPDKFLVRLACPDPVGRSVASIAAGYSHSTSESTCSEVEFRLHAISFFDRRRKGMTRYLCNINKTWT